jgi:hypothetical protein
LATQWWLGEDGQTLADSPEFIPLVGENFESYFIREVSAGKAYPGYDDFDDVAAIGGTAYMTFKKTATGRFGCCYGNMLLSFCLSQDDY